MSEFWLQRVNSEVETEGKWWSRVKQQAIISQNLVKSRERKVSYFCISLRICLNEIPKYSLTQRIMKIQESEWKQLIHSLVNLILVLRENRA